MSPQLYGIVMRQLRGNIREIGQMIDYRRALQHFARQSANTQEAIRQAAREIERERRQRQNSQGGAREPGGPWGPMTQGTDNPTGQTTDNHEPAETQAETQTDTGSGNGGRDNDADTIAGADTSGGDNGSIQIDVLRQVMMMQCA